MLLFSMAILKIFIKTLIFAGGNAFIGEGKILGVAGK